MGSVGGHIGRKDNLFITNNQIKENCVKEINSGDFITRNNLKAASSVNSSLKKLIDKELIYKTAHGYIVYDRFMAIWLRRQLY